MITLLGYDLETLGMAPPSAVIEIGWCSLEVGDGMRPTLGTLSGSMLRGIPEGQTMMPDNRAVHHIDPASLSGLPLFDPAEWSQHGADYAFAHNADFEQQWLSAIDPDLRWICTYKVALRLLPDAPSHSNQSLKYELGIEDDASHHPPHRALPDCIVTALVLERLIDMAQSLAPTTPLVRILDRFVEISREPRALPRCPIGKFRGRPWSEVETGFLQWMLRQTDMEADLRWCADQELQRRR